MLTKKDKEFYETYHKHLDEEIIRCKNEIELHNEHLKFFQEELKQSQDNLRLKKPFLAIDGRD